MWSAKAGVDTRGRGLSRILIPSPDSMDHEGHYADAFYVEAGQCFRMIMSTNSGSQGSPTHCPEPIEWHNRVQDRAGKWPKLESCAGHAGDLTDTRRIRDSAPLHPGR